MIIFLKLQYQKITMLYSTLGLCHYHFIIPLLLGHLGGLQFFMVVNNYAINIFG